MQLKEMHHIIISDFIVPDFEEALRIASNKHDIVALKIYDPVRLRFRILAWLKFWMLNPVLKNG